MCHSISSVSIQLELSSTDTVLGNFGHFLEFFREIYGLVLFLSGI